MNQSHNFPFPRSSTRARRGMGFVTIVPSKVEALCWVFFGEGLRASVRSPGAIPEGGARHAKAEEEEEEYVWVCGGRRPPAVQLNPWKARGRVYCSAFAKAWVMVVIRDDTRPNKLAPPHRDV